MGGGKEGKQGMELIFLDLVGRESTNFLSLDRFYYSFFSLFF